MLQTPLLGYSGGNRFAGRSSHLHPMALFPRSDNGGIRTSHSDRVSRITRQKPLRHLREAVCASQGIKGKHEDHIKTAVRPTLRRNFSVAKDGIRNRVDVFMLPRNQDRPTALRDHCRLWQLQ
jgi:hypothetical protein